MVFLEALKRHYEAYLSGKLKGEESIAEAGGDCINEELKRVMELSPWPRSWVPQVLQQ